MLIWFALACNSHFKVKAHHICRFQCLTNTHNMKKICKIESEWTHNVISFIRGDVLRLGSAVFDLDADYLKSIEKTKQKCRMDFSFFHELVYQYCCISTTILWIYTNPFPFFLENLV